jgi:hypothetical protein
VDLFSEKLMYEFHVQELGQIEALKQYADHVVKEIKTTAGWDTYVHVSIEPLGKDKRLFSVSMSVFGLNEPIVVSKEGKHVLAVLRKVRKTVLRQIHRLVQRKIVQRRKQLFKPQVASS